MLHPARIGLAALALAAIAAGALGCRDATPAPAAAYRFEPNLGQSGPEVRFLARGASHTVFLTGDGPWWRLRGPRSAGLSMRFAGHSQEAVLEGEDHLPSRSHYLGPRPLTRVPHYARVRYRGLYPGVEAVFYSRGAALEYDLEVAPGADPGRIELEFAGHESIEAAPDGALLLRTAAGATRFAPPVIYQAAAGRKRPVEGRYRLLEAGRAGFALGAYDPALTLVIDPVVDFSTFFGGSGLDSGAAVGVDGSGNVYLAGSTESVDLPQASRPRPQGDLPRDAFIAKFDPSGANLLWTAYLGGRLNDEALALAVDAAGNAYVAGRTNSTDFPTTTGAPQRVLGDTVGGDAFAAKLDPSGANLLWSTLLGGNDTDAALAIALDPQSNVYLAGETLSANFPSRNAFRVQPCAGPSSDGFAAKIAADGRALVYAAYLCGSAPARASAIAVGADGSAYVAGDTLSANFPTTPGAFTTQPRGRRDGFVSKVSPDGLRLTYSTLLGGGDDEEVAGIAVTAAGAAYLTGRTASADFPVTPGVLGPAHRRPGFTGDAFVTALNPAGAALLFSTFLGGSSDDAGTAIAVDAAGAAWVAGWTGSADFPVPAAPCDPQSSRGQDAFAVKLAPGATDLNWGLLLGGWEADRANAIALRQNRAYLAGDTRSVQFPTTQGAFRTAYRRGFRGVADAFLTAVSDAPSPTPPCVFLNGVVNAASFLPGPVAPGQIVSLFGAGLGPEQLTGLVVQGGFVTTALAGTRVLFDGQPAPLLAVSAGQINTVVPYAVAGRAETLIEVERLGQRTPAVRVPVAATAPGIFSLDSSGRGPGAVLNQDHTVNSAANPADRGSILVIYATGAGQTDPAGLDGQVIPPVLPLPVPRATVSALVGGLAAEVVFAGSPAELVSGVLQVNARVPLEARPGTAVPVQLVIDGEVSQTGLTVAIR